MVNLLFCDDVAHIITQNELLDTKWLFHFSDAKYEIIFGLIFLLMQGSYSMWKFNYNFTIDPVEMFVLKYEDKKNDFK